MRLGFDNIPRNELDAVRPARVEVHPRQGGNVDRRNSLLRQFDIEERIACAKQNAFLGWSSENEASEQLNTSGHSFSASGDFIIGFDKAHVASRDITATEYDRTIDQFDWSISNRGVTTCSACDANTFRRGDIRQGPRRIAEEVLPMGNIVGRCVVSGEKRSDCWDVIPENFDRSLAGQHFDACRPAFKNELGGALGQSLFGPGQAICNVQGEIANVHGAAGNRKADRNFGPKAASTHLDDFNDRIGAEVPFELRDANNFSYEKEREFGAGDTVELDVERKLVLCLDFQFQDQFPLFVRLMAESNTFGQTL